MIEGITRKNCLFLSAAAQNNHAALTPVFKWLSELRFFADFLLSRGSSQFTASLCAESQFAVAMAGLLRAADIGIMNLRVENEALSEDTRAIWTTVFKAVKNSISDNSNNQIPDNPPESLPTIRLFHRLGGETLALAEASESAGTTAYLRVLGPVLKALNDGAVLCVDELDASLQPLLGSQIVRLFNDPSINRKGAQLIFNTHDTTLLSRANLRRDQIWFTEKGEDGTER